MVGFGDAVFQAGEIYETAINKIIQNTGAENEKLASLGDSFSTVFRGVPESAQNVAESLSPGFVATEPIGRCAR